MKDIKEYSLESLKKVLIEMNEKPFRAEQIFKWIYIEKVNNFDEMTDISKELREKLSLRFKIESFKLIEKQVSKDNTKKYLFDLLDGNAIETVLMEYKHGNTLCISTQVGCKMGCTFCASTGIHFERDLTAGEIVEQVLAVEKIENIKINNVVYMGIGEPFDNYDNVIESIRIINDQKGLNIGARKISISTSGIVPRIYDFIEENIQVTLSISLHATSNKKRSMLMPINNKYTLEELLKACKVYTDKTNRRITFEYALVRGENDSIYDAKELVKILKGIHCHINLIPINELENNKYKKSSNEDVLKFRNYLVNNGVVATVRRELGQDIDAACGQLRKKELK